MFRLEFEKLEKVWGVFILLIEEPLEDSEDSSEDYFDFEESSRHPDLEYDDQQPDEEGLTFSEYHVLEW